MQRPFGKKETIPDIHPVISSPNPRSIDMVHSTTSGNRLQSASRHNTNSDTKAKAILDVFASDLSRLGDERLPGIRVVTASILRIMKHMKMKEVQPGWQQLADRMENLAFLLLKTIQYPDAKDSIEDVCAKRKDELELVEKQVSLPVFLDSSPTLDEIIKDLTGAISSETTQTKSKLKQTFEDEISGISEKIEANGHSSGLTFRMANTHIGDVGGTFDSDNKAYGGVGIHRILQGNTIGNVKGKMFSGNLAGA